MEMLSGAKHRSLPLHIRCGTEQHLAQKDKSVTFIFPSDHPSGFALQCGCAAGRLPGPSRTLKPPPRSARPAMLAQQGHSFRGAQGSGRVQKHASPRPAGPPCSCTAVRFNAKLLTLKNTSWLC